jgi:type I restriction enzyme M protein
MLDTDTKRRIDTARDILVGKVPDPKSQVEQITIALIYKFMDDMDAESEEFGGKRKFFANEFARYGWAKLMHSGLGGHETLNLYAEAIAKMPENPGIPLLFRDIFKNAYLPYRDPETLKMFLKVIDEFEYNHSERLGDAFEYLLSVLGSQGDAGQFRTPRHIIDFMVEIIDPKKTETVLDPACGTAGFLISSYKHILKANTDAKGNSTLTPDDKGRLAKNFKGYDISPDMVRLSLVNLYLHGFADPHIAEYDTLTSQDRWNEYADVILANPPFMSPKGGIKPHNRFSVQSKRSEVLFVDYMAEHLTPSGRAGIIVPEGIIFQSQTAYKQLRKMLAEEYLVAVVSLPAGVFNPYSGVKTSILILDKTLAKRTNTIAFFKIEKDGYGLGAQRRPLCSDNGDRPELCPRHSDLPQVNAEIDEYLRRLRAGESVDDYQLTLGLIVAKEKIATNGEYNLSRERYREGTGSVSAWPLVPVGYVFYKSEESVLPESLQNAVTYIGLENLTQNTGEITGNVVTEKPAEIKSLKNVFKPGDLLYGKLRPNLNKVWVADRKGICSTDIFVIRPIEGKAIPALYGYIFRSTRFNDAVLTQLKGAQLPRIGWSSFAELQIPLPPLEVQKEIVAEIEGYQKVINGARAVLDHYRPHIPIHPDWPVVELGDAFRKSEKSVLPDSLNGPVTYIGLENISQGTGEIIGNIVTENPAAIKSLKNVFQQGDILYGKLRPKLNKVWLADRQGICSTDIFVIQPLGNQVIPAFYTNILRSESFNERVMSQIKGAQLPRVGWSSFASINIPLPPLATQQAIVDEIEAEQPLVAANCELVARMEKKIQATLARVWGEDKPAPAEA